MDGEEEESKNGFLDPYSAHCVGTSSARGNTKKRTKPDPRIYHSWIALLEHLGNTLRWMAPLCFFGDILIKEAGLLYYPRERSPVLLPPSVFPWVSSQKMRWSTESCKSGSHSWSCLLNTRFLPLLSLFSFLLFPFAFFNLSHHHHLSFHGWSYLYTRSVYQYCVHRGILQTICILYPYFETRIRVHQVKLSGLCTPRMWWELNGTLSILNKRSSDSSH